mmetsp:Transcript_56943/g.105296  ORF Transcript_56943/g.105296 Transcript_56943/m.105296 type:complete len:154 (-) Transcript_56943:215-676(-)
MPLSIVPYPSLVLAAVQYAHPLSCCYDKFFRNSDASDVDYVQWTVYWAICAVWHTLEQLVLWVLVDYCPFYLELKMLFFLWLSMPTYKGAAYLWYGILQPLHKPLDDKHYEQVIGILSKVKLPDVLNPGGAAGEDGASMDDIMASNLKGNKSS